MKKAEELKLYAPEPKRPELDAALSMSVAEGQGVGRYIKGKVLTVAVWDKRKSRWSCGAFSKITGRESFAGIRIRPKASFRRFKSRSNPASA